MSEAGEKLIKAAEQALEIARSPLLEIRRRSGVSLFVIREPADDKRATKLMTLLRKAEKLYPGEEFDLVIISPHPTKAQKSASAACSDEGEG